jgi:hypothetical protein
VIGEAAVAFHSNGLEEMGQELTLMSSESVAGKDFTLGEIKERLAQSITTGAVSGAAINSAVQIIRPRLDSESNPEDELNGSDLAPKIQSDDGGQLNDSWMRKWWTSAGLYDPFSVASGNNKVAKEVSDLVARANQNEKARTLEARQIVRDFFEATRLELNIRKAKGRPDANPKDVLNDSLEALEISFNPDSGLELDKIDIKSQDRVDSLRKHSREAFDKFETDEIKRTIGSPFVEGLEGSGMRGMIDFLSMDLVSSNAAKTSDMKNVLANNLGRYLRREYMVNLNPEKQRKIIADNPGIKKALKDKLEKSSAFKIKISPDIDPSWNVMEFDPETGLVFNVIDKLDEDISSRFVSGSINVESAIAEQRSRKIDSYMETILATDPDPWGVYRSAVPKSDGSEFMRRTLDPEKNKEMADYLGYIKDPVDRFVSGVSRMAHDLETHKLHEDLLELGDGIFFFNDITKKGRINFDSQVSSKKRTPITGKYTSPEISAILNGVTSSQSDLGWAMNGWFQGIRLIRLGKTLGSIPRGYIRNIQAWPAISVATGASLPSVAGAVAGFQAGSMFGIPGAIAGTVGGAVLGGVAGRKVGGAFSDPSISGWTKSLAREVSTITDKQNSPLGLRFIQQALSSAKLEDGLRLIDKVKLDKDTLRKEAIKLTELGVLDDGTMGGDVKEILRTSPRTISNNKVISVLGDYWSSGDSLGKSVIFYHELEMLKWAKGQPDGVDELKALEKEAAEFVNEATPTYSRVPPGVKAWRDSQPFFSDFPLFDSEIYRNGKNIIKKGLSQLREARDTGNPRIAVLGLRKLSGIGLAVIGFGHAISAVSNYFAGTDEEDEEAARNLGYEFEKNNDLLLPGS